jgi:hypothetical protein
MPFLKISEPRMPTPEEHRMTSLAWLERVGPTLIDQWPADLAALSMPTILVPAPDGLTREFYALHDGAKPGPVMTALAAELDAIMGWDRKFIRLNSRSPKDWPWPFEAPITCSGKEALSILASSMRVLDDLLEFSYVPEQPAYICLREHVHIDKSREYRCFVKDRRLIAVTRYDYHNLLEPFDDGGEALRARIDAWFEEKLLPVLHMDTVVFDVFDRGRDFLLIEINPYGMSDPCFFGTYANVEAAAAPIQCTFIDGAE